MPETPFNSSMVTTGKAEPWKYEKIDTLMLAAVSKVVRVVMVEEASAQEVAMVVLAVMV